MFRRQIRYLYSISQTYQTASTIIWTLHRFTFEVTDSQLHAGCTVWLYEFWPPGVAGDLRDEWALPGVTVASASFPCCPAQICPFLSSYLSMQCNLTQGAVPLLPYSPRCRSPSLIFSDVTVKREWPAGTELELGWLTESWHPHCRHDCFSFLPPTTSHPLTAVAPRAQRAQTMSHAADL